MNTDEARITDKNQGVGFALIRVYPWLRFYHYRRERQHKVEIFLKLQGSAVDKKIQAGK
jgi:hypothetical protein